MPMTAQHLPGCYRNLRCERDESLSGYLLRLAEANGYRGIRDLLRLVSTKLAGSTRTQLLKLFADQERLSLVARIAVGDSRHLQHFFAEALSPPTARTPGEALYMYERRVAVDALLPERCAVCPSCLREYGYLREVWDLAPVTVCAEHGTLLIDQCPSCDTEITLDRSHLLHCENCSADLRLARSTGADASTISVTTHFEALAPFRLLDRKGRTLSADWEEMFHLFKALLLPDSMWATGAFPASFVAETTIERRHDIVQQLAATLSNSSYDVSRLRHKPMNALAPFQALPIPHGLEDIAAKYLAVEAGLSRDMSEAICLENDRVEPPTAAERFGGHPPSLRSLRDIQRFLAASDSDVSRLVRLGVIARRSEDLIGHDADQLLSARRFLDSLIDVDGLSELAGVVVRDSDLHPDGLLPRWNDGARTDARVMPERVIELQRELAARWHQAQSPEMPLALRVLAQARDRPFELVGHIVRLIMMGNLRKFAWRPPFTWADIHVCQNELRARVL